MQGTSNHYLFLYGKNDTPYPKWIGYRIGFQIVNTFEKEHGPFTSKQLSTKSAEEIIAGSVFPFDQTFCTETKPSD
jgi:uncharacterized protein YjaZ